jgi:uncharacterized protein YjiS (DUF1127 family)
MISKTVQGWLARRRKARERRRLLALPDHILRDIGFSRDDLEGTSASPWER